MTHPLRPPSRGGFVFDLANRLLGYMDRPWKAAVVIVLLILGGLGWGLWTERQAVLDAFEAPKPIALKADLSGMLDNLIRETTADLVMVWSVDLRANTARFMLARQRVQEGSQPESGTAWGFTPGRLPAILDDSNSRTVAEILSGHPVCVVPADRRQTALIMRRLAADGMSYSCLVPVLPRDLVAFLFLAWKARPEAAIAAADLLAAVAAADHMVAR